MSSRQTRTRTRQLLAKYDINTRKHLGQHFLTDPNIVHKIVGLVGGDRGDRVLEIGTGSAAMTLALAEHGYEVLSYEVDRRLEPVIDEVIGHLANVEVRLEDAAAVDFASELSGHWKMAANLPYNIGTRLLLDLLTGVAAIERFVVMVQSEVGDRLRAKADSKAYGGSAVVTQLYASVTHAFDVPPQVFIPQPGVDSSVVILDRIEASPHAARACELAAAGFQQRRKMLKSSLRGPVSEPIRLLEAAGIDPTSRAEQITPSDWVRIAEAEDPAIG